MKKRFLFLTLAFGLASGVYAAENSGIKDEAKAAEYKRSAETDESMAKDAETKGNKDLAAAYKKCAEAKNRMSQAYSSGDKDALSKANTDCINSKIEVDKVQKGLNKKDGKPKEKASKTKLPK